MLALPVGFAATSGFPSTQLNPSVAVDDEVQAPEAHPAHCLHFPLRHWLLFVHQHDVPDVAHIPEDDFTVLQLPVEQDDWVSALQVD